MEPKPGPGVEGRREALSRLVVTILLLGMAYGSLLMRSDQTMAGAVIGYVAAYWLPPQRTPAKR